MSFVFFQFFKNSNTYILWGVFTLFSAVLKIKAVDRGVVVIRGTEAGRYLAMSDEGRLYGSVSIRRHPHVVNDKSITATAKNKPWAVVTFSPQ